MANPEHLKILEQGVEAWNIWRRDNPDIIPNLEGGNFFRKKLDKINFRGASLRDTGLAFTELNQAVLSDANLDSANLKHARLRNSSLTRASLIGADLSHAKLHGADFSLASLTFTDLNNAVLDNSLFSDAMLLGTNFTDAVFVNTDMSNAWIGKCLFVGNDLREAKGLNSVNHSGPSEVSISSIYLSDGDIPEHFLRGCGVPEDFITYMRSLVGKAIEFYTCFISFTEADDIFSERLYNDMRGAGIRCWRWKEDAKWGRTLMHSIDEAVRVYDKLIVICSEQSLNSPAVIREIERALQKEDAAAREGKEAEGLFPIRLDDYIFTDWQHHRKADVVAKNVGDFRQWMEPESYKKALQRLIRDLKAEARREG